MALNSDRPASAACNRKPMDDGSGPQRRGILAVSDRLMCGALFAFQTILS